MKTLRILLSCICIFLSNTISAYDFEVDGIYYNFIFDRFHCVSVTCSYDNPYNGEVNIPETVFYYGIYYNVVSVETLYGGNGNENITKVTMPSTIDTIDDFFFYYYDRNTELCGDCFYIEDGLIYDRDKTILYFCQDMIMSEQYTTPVVTTIGNYAFKGQNHIKEIVVPEGVEFIRGRGLGDIPNLSKVSFPASLKLQENIFEAAISWVTFEGSGNLEEINVSDGNLYLSSEEGVLYDKGKTEIIFYPYSSKISHYKFPTTLKENYTHSVRSESLTSFEIPQKVHEESMMYRIHGNFQDAIIPYGTKIVDLKSALLKFIKIPYNSLYSADVFSQSMESFCPPISSNSYVYGVQQCHYKSFVIPQGTLDYPFTFIHNSAFYNWSELESLVLPPTINTIYAGAFSGCDKLSCIELPSSLTHVENFLSHSNLSEIICKAVVPPTGDEYINDYLSKYSNDIVLKVPSGSVEAYKSTTPWSNINNIAGIDVEDNIEIEFAEYYIKYAKHLLKYTTEGTDYLDFPSSAKATLQSVINAVEPKINNHMTLQDATREKERMLAAIYAYYNKQVGYNGGNVDPEDEPTPPSEDEKDTDISEFDNVVYFENATIKGGQQIVLPLQLKNKMDVASMTFDVYMPEGVEIDKNARGNYNITFNAEANRADATTHTLTSKLQADDAVRVLCYSATAETFLGNEGAVFDFPVTVASAMEAGDYKVVIRNIELTDAQGKSVYIDKVVSTLTVPSYTLGDANDDGKIGTADIMYIVNKILGTPAEDFNAQAADINEDGKIGTADLMMVVQYILNGEFPAVTAAAKGYGAKPQSNVTLKVKPFAINAGETKTITLELDNEGVDASGFVCDIKLPKGLAADVDAMAFNATANRTNAAFHAMPVAIQADGAVRILCYSANGESLLGMSGAVIDIPVTASADIEQGEAVLTIANQEVVNADGTKVYCPEAYQSKILIGGVTGISNTNGAAETPDAIYTLDGVKQGEVQNGINVIIKNGEVIKATK